MDPAAFYDALAAHFHLIHEDWNASIATQGEQLDQVIRANVHAPDRVLDCACGIGTQAIALSLRGYDVTGSDIAEAALERARSECAARDLSVDLCAADMRTLTSVHQDPFDVVLAADNSVPHLLTDDEIRQAFGEMRRLTRPGGVCLVSVRDYAAMAETGVHFEAHAAHRVDGTLYTVFQVREVHGATYTINLYIVTDDDTPTVRVARSTYYAVSTDRLLALLEEAGFDAVERDDTAYVQPLLIARAATDG